VNLALKKWPMLVLVGIGRGAARYGELAAMIPLISPRALSGALRDLVEAGVAERSPDGGYRLTAKGEALQPVMEQLVATAEGEGRFAAGRGR
jgi:DNA-binding HxlR family transcriptional regulator